MNFVWKEFDRKTIIIEFNNLVLRKKHVNDYLLVNIDVLIKKTEKLKDSLSREYLIIE